MDELVPAFEESIFDPSLADACADLAEAGIDAIINNDAIKAIPFASPVIGIARTILNVRDRNVLRQTAAFVSSLHEGTIDYEKLERHREELKKNPKKANKELGRVMVLLDRSVDLKKSRILGRIYRAFLYGELDWEGFCELAEALDRAFLSDLKLLCRIRLGEIEKTDSDTEYRASRLASLGLLNETMARMSSVETRHYVSCTNLGNSMAIFVEEVPEA